MPFDGSHFPPPAKNPDELKILSEMLAYFDAGDHWLRGDWSDSDGRVCILEAYARIRQSLRIGPNKALRFIRRAIRQHHPNGNVMQFNDEHCSGFAELRNTLRLAERLAENYDVADLPKPPRQPTLYRPGASAEMMFVTLERPSGAAGGHQLAFEDAALSA